MNPTKLPESGPIAGSGSSEEEARGDFDLSWFSELAQVLDLKLDDVVSAFQRAVSK